MSFRLARPLLVLTLTAAVLSGCGNARTPLPDVATPGPRLGDNPVDNAAGGYRLIAPVGWNIAPGDGPLVSTISRGPAIVSIFRYPRSEQLPATREQLDRAITDLLAAAKARDATFSAIRSARLKVDGQPAIQVRATETVAGLPRTVRSTHVYAFGAELVVDMMAPTDSFRSIDALYFRPLLDTLRLRAPTA